MRFILWIFILLFTLSSAFNVADTDYVSKILAVTGTTTGKSFQFPISNAGDINKDGRDDIIIGGYGQEDDGKLESAYLIYGQQDFTAVNLNFKDFKVDQANAGTVITGTNGWDGFGTFVSGAGDIDGDKNDDFMIGAYRKNGHQGRVYVIYGKPGLQNLQVFPTDMDPKTTGFFIEGNVRENYLGFSISKAGRINGDQLDDIIIGIHGKNTKTGAAAVIYGGPKETRTNVNVNDEFAVISPEGAGFSMLGEAEGDLFGYSVSNAGDVNGDGKDDIIVGAPGNSSRIGAAYVIYGSDSPTNIDLSSETLDPASTGFSIRWKAEGEFFGVSVSAAGDVNGDGIDDVIIGANNTDSGAGSAYIIYGSRIPSDIDLSTETLRAASTGFVVKGASGDQFGFSVKSAGDLNNDGYADVMIGAPSKGGSGKGGVYVILGRKPESLVDVLDLSSETLNPATTGFVWTRDTSDTSFGYSISSGDFNGDGKTELFVGSMTKAASPRVGYVIGLSQMCSSNCDGCGVPTTCGTCKTNFELVETTKQCRQCNAIGEFYERINKCGTCISDCDTCTDGSSCSKCSNTFGYQGSACITCPDNVNGKYLDGNLCKDCMQDCTKCSDISSCDVCKSGFGYYSNNTCIDCVQPGKFLDQYKCKDCIGNCSQCSNVNTCEICYEGFGRWDLNKECIECPQTGKFLDGGECFDCVGNCDICSDDKKCEMCSNTFGRWNDDKECVKCPDNGKFIDDGECFKCVDNCKDCSNNKTCEICSDTFGRWDEDKECIKCPDTGKFIDGGKCFDCIKNCDKCFDNKTCETCLPTFGKYKGECVTCPNTTYLMNGVCEECIVGCDQCSNSDKCEICSEGFGFWDSVCVDQCPEKMYLADDRICKGCIRDCDQCSNGSACDYCSDGFGLLDSVCVDSCPVKMRLSADRICKNCIPGCDQCSDDKSCDYCSLGFGLLGSVCVDPCPITKYLSAGRICEGCIKHCDQCSNSDKCEVCSDKYGLFDSVCISCPVKMYLSDAGKCEDCIPNCDVCSGSTSCKNCSSEYGLLNSRCTKCPTGMFLSSTGECLTCGPNCNQCSNSTSCQVCSDGYGVLNSKCLSNPQEGLYLSNGTFLACSEGCSQCLEASKCQVCADDYLLSEWNTCIEKKEESQNVASSSTFEGASIVGAALSSGSSLPFNFGMTSKMVRNIKYLNISVSAELRQSFVSWTATSSFLKAPESWGSNSDSEVESGSRMLQEVFGRYGLEPAFLINYWKTLIITLIGVVLFGIFKAIEVCFTKENTKGHSIARAVHIAASNFALTQFYSNLDDVVLYLAIDARSSKLDTSFGLVSFIIGVSLLVIGAIALAVHILLLRKYQGLKKKQAEFETFKSKSQNFDLLFKDFKDNSLSTQSFLLVVLVRCIVASLIFALLFEYPFLQIFMLLFLNASMLTFLLVVRPFKDVFDTCGQFFSEFILLLVNICMFILAIFGQAESKPLELIDKLSRCVIVLNVILLVGCAVFLIISILRLLCNLYKIYKEKRQTKNTSMALSSLAKKLDGLKLNNQDQKTSNFEQSNESQQNLHNITDQVGLSLDKANSGGLFIENQAEDVFNTSYGNLNLSEYFAERDLKLKYGAAVKPGKAKKVKEEFDEKKRENIEENLSNSGIFDHDEEEANIDPDENKIQKDISPLQDFGASFKKKKMNQKAPKAENSIKENPANSETPNPNEVVNVESTDSFADKDLLLKSESQSAEIQKLEELDENGEKEEERLSNSGVVNNDESANIDPTENKIEKEIIPLQDFGATFKKKKVPKGKKSEEKRLDVGVSKNNEAVSLEPIGSEIEKDLQIETPEMKDFEEEFEEKNQENKEEALPDFDVLNHSESADINPNENQTETVIPLQNFESTFKKKKNKKATKVENTPENLLNSEDVDVEATDSFPEKDIQSINGSQIKSPEMKKLKVELHEIGEKEEENFPTSAVNESAHMKPRTSFIEIELQPKTESSKVERELNEEIDLKNLSNSEVFNNEESADIDPNENQTENNVIPLQGFEASFKKKKNAPKVEDIMVEHMREDTSMNLSLL